MKFVCRRLSCFPFFFYLAFAASGQETRSLTSLRRSINNYLSSDESVLKNSAGAAMRSPVRFATDWIKCLVLGVSNQSGLPPLAERSLSTGLRRSLFPFSTAGVSE